MKKLLLILFVSLLLINMTTAMLEVAKPVELIKGEKFVFDGKEIDYNNIWDIYKPISVRTNWDLPLISSTKLDAYIEQHDFSCGVDCSSTIILKTYETAPLIEDIRFYTLDGDKRTLQNIRNYQFYIKTNEEEYEVNDYKWTCTPTGKKNVNGTDEVKCENKLIGTHKEKKPLWEEYNIGDEVSAGIYEVKLEGEKKSERIVDWQIKTNGVWTEDWAVWGGNILFNGTMLYYDLDTYNLVDKNGVLIESVSGLANFTNSSATIPTLATGIINNGTTSYAGTGWSGKLLTGIPDSYDLGTGNWTWNFWMNLNDTTNGNTIFTGDVGGDAIYVQSLSNGGLIRLDWGGIGAAGNTQFSAKNKTWYMITIVGNASNGGKKDFYVNGVFNSTIDIASGLNFTKIFESANGFELGDVASGVNGTIDEVGIWNRSLTTGEINELYNLNSNGIGYSAFTGNYVILNSPTDAYISPTNSVDFNCSATVTGGATLTNMSLWHNATGTWERNQTLTTTNYSIANYTTGETAGDEIWGDNWYGQTFNVTQSYTIQSVGVKLFEEGTTVEDMTLGIRLVNASGQPTGIDLTNKTLVSSIVSGGSPGNWYNFTDLNYVLSPGVEYAIVLRCPSCDIGNNINWDYDGTASTFPSGEYTKSVDGGVNWVNTGTIDFIFEIFGATDTIIFTTPITKSTLWTCEACDSDGDCGFASENRTVGADTNAPNIILYNPAIIENLGQYNVNQTLNWSIIDTSLDSVWWDYNGTNTTLNGAINSSSFTLEPLLYSGILWANDSVGNIANLSRTWNYTIFVNGLSYNTTTYETARESFTVNTTGTVLNAYLNYAGTSYEATQSGNIWTRSLDIATISSPTNRSWFWSFNSGTINNSILNQSVLETNLSLCGGSGGSIPYLNFTFKDEGSGDIINASNDLATFTYWLGSGDVTKTYLHTNTTDHFSYGFCATPPDRSLTIDLEFKYSKTNYPLRTTSYDDLVLTNLTTNTTLYLLSATDGIYVTFQVLDATTESPISGVSVTITRDIGGITTIVGEGVTDGSGSVTFWLNPNYAHTITATKTGYPITTQTVTPTQSSYTILMGTSDTVSIPDYIYEGIKWSTYPPIGRLEPNTIYKFGFNVTTTQDNIVSCKLEIRDINGTIVASTTTGCSSGGGNLSVLYNVTTSPKLFGYYYLDLGDGLGLFKANDAWFVEFIDTGSQSGLKIFFEELKDLPDWGDGHNRREFSRIVFYFFFMILLVGIFSFFVGGEMASPGTGLIIVWAFIALGSVSGMLYIWGLSPYAWFNKYGIFMITTFIFMGFIINYFRKESMQ